MTPITWNAGLESGDGPGPLGLSASLSAWV
jgi:hypothetical protein